MIMEHVHGSAEERRSAEALRDKMGLAQNLPIAKRGFTKAQRDYFIACNEMGIHYKTSAELMGVTRPERVKSYLDHKSCNPRGSNSIHSPNANGPSNVAQDENHATKKDYSREEGSGERIKSLSKNRTDSPDLNTESTRSLFFARIYGGYLLFESLNLVFELENYLMILGLRGVKEEPGRKREQAYELMFGIARELYANLNRYVEGVKPHAPQLLVDQKAEIERTRKGLEGFLAEVLLDERK